jgi:hypothetical protein
MRIADAVVGAPTCRERGDKINRKNGLDNPAPAPVNWPCDMKNSPLTTVLLLLVLGSALGSIFYCWRLVSKNRELRNLQAQVNFINYKQAAMQSLAKDAQEYSKKNRAIDPILEAAGLPTGTAASSNKPVSR